MHDYLLSTEWIRFAFVLGVAVSMVMYERRHLTTGSIVVPGYIAVFIIHPLVIVATFLNAFITYALINKLLRRYLLLYGRTKFTVLAIVSTLIQTAMLRVAPSGRWLWERDIPLFIGVGYIIPALIAHDMARQGVWKTTKSVLMAGMIVAIPIAAALAFDLPGVNDLAPISGFGQLAFSPRWLPLAVMLSVLASWAVAMNYNLRSGGFVGAAFAGMFMADPWQVVAALGVALVTWLIVAKFLMNHMILFGRRKFSAMLLVSSAIAWVCLWVGDRVLDVGWQQHFGVGSLALTPLLLPGLIANDAQRTSPMRVVAGLSLAASFVVPTTWWVQSGVTGSPLGMGWKAMALISFAVLFAKQFARLAEHVGSRALVAARRLVPSEPRRPTPARVLAMASDGSPSGTAHVDWMTSWDEWTRRHPDLASDAEDWVSNQLVRPVVPASRPVAVNGYIEGVAIAVLKRALDRERGVRRVPGSRVTADLGGDSTHRPVTQVSETSDAAPREAQPAASDVSEESLSPMGVR